MVKIKCPNKLLHTLKQGDSLYKIAKYYKTTVPMLLSLNPRINPYNLQAGNKITVCPGETFALQAHTPLDHAAQFTLLSDMRVAWEQHVYWTRMLLLSISEMLKDQHDVTARLLKNPSDIAKIFALYYSPSAAKTVEILLAEHLQLGAELITALRDNDSTQSDSLMRQWYINADQMSEFLSSINPYYNHDNVRKMLYTHLDLTTQEVSSRLAGKYPDDIDFFDKVEQKALEMADFFSNGIMRQFPQNFS